MSMMFKKGNKSSNIVDANVVEEKLPEEAVLEKDATKENQEDKQQ